MENTKPGYGNMELYNVWSVDRREEGQRFKAHDKVANRKLLWHGTNGEGGIACRLVSTMQRVPTMGLSRIFTPLLAVSPI